MNIVASQSEQYPEDSREATATVKVMLHPDIRIFTMDFNMNKTMEQMKQYFAARLKLPPNVLQLMLLGRIIENSVTLWNLGVKPHETIQLDMFSLDEEQFPIISSKLLNEYYMPDVITVRVQTDSDTFQDLLVSIKRPSFKKPFLGGFRHKETGMEYHHAGSQTIPKKCPEKGYIEYCRSTQTVVERKKLLQTRSAASTQMTKIGVYMSNITDKLIEPKGYVTADEYHARRLQAVIVIQTYFRRWHAINVVKELKEQLRLRLEWEAEEERRLQREKAERLMKEYNRRMVPRTKDDFELLYHALELWRLEELERIDNTLSGAERKAALCALLEKEAQLIASIGRHKLNADEVNQQKAIMSFLEKCAEPKRWKAFDGKITEMDTQFTLRARELLEIYRSISMQDLPTDERLDVLLTLKHTVKEHECKLTHEIIELIDREADLMMRGVKECNLEGLRKRICTLFLQYIKTPFFNPEVARLLKVPPDPIKLYHNIYFCLGCKRYLPSTDFAISGSSHSIGRCHLCCKLDNQACKREAFLKYKRMLRSLRQSEVNYMDGAKIAFVLQLQDLQYMVENFWNSQSAISAWGDLYDLVMVRWDKHVEWSPWNTILLRNDEAESHLKLKNLEKAYETVFIHRVKHKHLLARNYFSQFPELGEALHKADKLACSNDLLVTKPITPGPSKSTHKEG
ncbi:IQ motif and ubiquitin-like domain-containing protein [Tiliqua scincoides]|uniref:IQ motif and ubiquitin-like domain-containing protein n=1 Tax=Tiliqua scincoides TaxID=71010 RepID=UPI00346290B6